MPQILKAEIQTSSPVSMAGVKNVFSNLLYRKPFMSIERHQKEMLCQALAAGFSLAMILPLAVILYYLINNFL